MQNALKKLKDEKGFALIITIMIFALLIPLTLQFNDSMQQNKISAATHKYDIQLSCAARSGIQYTLAVLYADADLTKFDSLLEAWAIEEELNADTGSALEGVKFKVKINDLSGKINVNRLVDTDSQTVSVDQQDILTRLLVSLDLRSGGEEISEEQIGDFVNSLIDWIDQDNDITVQGGVGAEKSDYQGSVRIDGPIEDMEDLSIIMERIEWITEDIETRLLNDLTIYGDKININTAGLRVLKSLSDDIYDKEAIEMDTYRMDTDYENTLNNTSWYKAALGIGLDYIIPGIITVSSTHFEIISTGSRGEMEKTITAIVERDQKGTFIIRSQKLE